MMRMKDRIVLAIECGHCRQITGMKVYNKTLLIDRCGACGQNFPAVDDLLRQYALYSHRIEHHEPLRQTLEEARAAVQMALAHWGQQAGKEALTRVLPHETVANAEPYHDHTIMSI
jgi:hypothetical protein